MEKVVSKYKISSFTSIKGLILWSLVRHKYLIPAFSIAQVAFAIAIIYGMGLFITQMDEVSQIYLASGAITLGMIAVGCVLAPQIVSESKQNGIYEYQRTLPVSRNAILLSDIIIWGVAALPGIAVGCIVSALRFDISININILNILLIIFALFTMICIGFCIAYWLPPNVMALATQVIMIGGLLFSPITYPADRLPEWTRYIYQNLPFVPISNMIRMYLFHADATVNIAVIAFWASASYILALCALSIRK